jgi:PAS domain S-box-containing protein
MSPTDHSGHFPLRYFSALFKNSRQNTMLLMDEAGIIEAVNNAFTTSFGYTADDIVGKEPGDFIYRRGPKKKGFLRKNLKKYCRQVRRSTIISWFIRT